MASEGRIAGVPRGLLAALFVLALALRLIVPSGFMPAAAAPGIVVSICDGTDRGRTTLLALPPADAGDRQDQPQQAAGACPFATLSAPALTAIPPTAAATPAPAPLRFAATPPRAFGLAPADFLTPPLRGPPARA